MWLTEIDPELLIAALQNRADEQRLRRLACAFARAAWPWLTDERSRHAVEVAERFASGTANHAELVAAETLAKAVLDNGGIPFIGNIGGSQPESVRWYAARCAANAANTRAWTSTTNSASWFAAMLACEALSEAMFEDAGVTQILHPRWITESEESEAILCAIIRAEFSESPFSS